jgi:acyl carrier protein
MSSTEERLRAIFREVFNLGDGVDPASCRQNETAQWDSLAHVSMIAALESEFNLTVDTSDALELTSFESVRRYLTNARVE